MFGLKELESQILAAIGEAETEESLEAERIAALGKRGSISTLLATLGKMPPEERKVQGAAINLLKNRVSEALATRRSILNTMSIKARIEAERLDVSLPSRLYQQDFGRVHPITQVCEELAAIFTEMGFSIAEGPDIETDDYNFTRLNFAPDHPAREMHDTFFLEPDQSGERKVLRTHTSPVQVRSMLKQNPPINIICPGRTYRCDSDQTHTPMFHQVEGLVINKTANLANLKWVLEEFCRAFFEVPNVQMRFRPSYFPFTEPSMEVDIQCTRKASEIKIGEGHDWLEILGCGMVHPNVLLNCGFDPDIYQGFAWGIGIDRIAMLKYGLPDLRAFFEADMRWLSYYGFRPLDLPSLMSGLSSL